MGDINDQLKSIVDRIERMDGDRADISRDIRDVYLEAKGNGFDAKIIRKIIALRKKSAEDRQEEDALIDTYMSALGMLPLFAAAANKDAASRDARQ